jgi:hypothetical protein
MSNVELPKARYQSKNIYRKLIGRYRHNATFAHPCYFLDYVEAPNTCPHC